MSREGLGEVGLGWGLTVAETLPPDAGDSPEAYQAY